MTGPTMNFYPEPLNQAVVRLFRPESLPNRTGPPAAYSSSLLSRRMIAARSAAMDSSLCSRSRRSSRQSSLARRPIGRRRGHRRNALKFGEHGTMLKAHKPG